MIKVRWEEDAQVARCWLRSQEPRSKDGSLRYNVKAKEFVVFLSWESVHQVGNLDGKQQVSDRRYPQKDTENFKNDGDLERWEVTFFFFLTTVAIMVGQGSAWKHCIANNWWRDE